MNIRKSDYIKGKVLDNLLSLQDKLSKTGNVKDNIRLAKYLLKLSKKFDNVVYQITSEERK